MECLTNEEIDQWHERFGQGESEPAFHLKFSAPATHQGVETFVRWFLQQVVISGELLVVLTDSAPAEPCHEFVSDAVRRAFGDSRPLEAAPGYRMDFEESEAAIALFAMMSSFGWKCYLYADHDYLTLYNWEGATFDTWTSSEPKHQELRRVIPNWGLREIQLPTENKDPESWVPLDDLTRETERSKQRRDYESSLSRVENKPLPRLKAQAEYLDNYFLHWIELLRHETEVPYALLDNGYFLALEAGSAVAGGDVARLAQPESTLIVRAWTDYRESLEALRKSPQTVKTDAEASYLKLKTFADSLQGK